MMSDAEAVKQLSEAPMEMSVIVPWVEVTEVDTTEGAEFYFVSLAARARFSQQLERGVMRCLCCEDASWSKDVDAVTVPLAGICVLVTAPAFRDPDAEHRPMLTSGICLHCVEDRATLSDRVHDALRKVWPNLQTFPMGRLAPGSSSSN